MSLSRTREFRCSRFYIYSSKNTLGRIDECYVQPQKAEIVNTLVLESNPVPRRAYIARRYISDGFSAQGQHGKAGRANDVMMRRRIQPSSRNASCLALLPETNSERARRPTLMYHASD